MMNSSMGCTLRISPYSNKIRGLVEPEKVKEFNKALTKAEIFAEENAAKKKEQYVQALEEKYDGKSVQMIWEIILISVLLIIHLLSSFIRNLTKVPPARGEQKEPEAREHSNYGLLQDKERAGSRDGQAPQRTTIESCSLV